MRSIHSKTFLDVWQALYHQSNPGPAASNWRCDDVEWTRETYRVGGQAYSFHTEAHVLSRDGDARSAWTLLVVVERWWAPGQRDVLKTTQWRQVLKGKDKHVLDWFERQRSRLDARFAAEPTGDDD